jgi:hypothetical protein
MCQHRNASCIRRALTSETGRRAAAVVTGGMQSLASAVRLMVLPDAAILS